VAVLERENKDLRLKVRHLTDKLKEEEKKQQFIPRPKSSRKEPL
jgi:hypothetical protein